MYRSRDLLLAQQMAAQQQYVAKQQCLAQIHSATTFIKKNKKPPEKEKDIFDPLDLDIQKEVKLSLTEIY